MKGTIKLQTRIVFLISIISIVITIIISYVTYHNQALRLKNKELLMVQAETIESISRIILQNYILGKAETDNSFAIFNLNLENSPKMNTLVEIIPALKNGSEITIDNVKRHYPALPAEFQEDMKEMGLLINAFFYIRDKVLNSQAEHREKNLALLNNIIGQLSLRSKTINRLMDREIAKSRLYFFTAIGVSVVIILLSFIYFYRMVLRRILLPLSKIVGIASKVSKKDLTILIDKDHKKLTWNLENRKSSENNFNNGKNSNEIDQLIDSINNMIISYKGLIGDIGSMIYDLNIKSDELNSISENLESRSETQASTFEETSSANEELMASIENVAGSAQEQANRVSNTRTAIEELSATMHLMGQNAKNVRIESGDTVIQVKSMERLLKKTTDSMDQISMSSKKIGEIISIINDISDQINLLSLNASIEAARAGEHGTGFAVVAQEISKLADATANSTGEIETLIKLSINEIDDGTQMVNQTADSISIMTAKIEDSASLIEQITFSIDEQIKAISNVMADIGVINEMSDKIAYSTDEQKITSSEILKAVSEVNESIQELVGISQTISEASRLIKSKGVVLRNSIEGYAV